MHTEHELAAFAAVQRNLLGPIVGYMNDPAVSEILVNGPYEVFIEKGGLLQRVDARFDDEDHLDAVATHLAQYVHRRFHRGSRVDGHLSDGSRIHILHGIASSKGTLLSVRRFSAKPFSVDELVQKQSLTEEAANTLKALVALKKNIVVAGATGTGKTTFLGALAALLPEHERIFVLEDSRELRIDRPHVVYLTVKAPGPDGEGGLTMRDLLHSSLRLRPDVLILGEVRSAEALDLIQALSSGHGGSFSTVHASNPRAVVARLETLALLAMPSLGIAALRRQVCDAVDVVVQLSRMGDGRRLVTAITEIDGTDINSEPILSPLFELAHKGAHRGTLVWSGQKSRFSTEFHRYFSEETNTEVPSPFLP